MIDHRKSQSPVRSQGERPTCAAFAVSAGHEWAANDEEIQSVEDAMWASEQIPVGLPDSRVRRALQGLEAHEQATEAAWPYGNPTYDVGRPDAAADPANRRAFPPWRMLPELTLEMVRDELGQGNPVIVSLRVVAPIWHRATGEIDAEASRLAPASHAVLAVGASEEGEEPEQLVIKNSWGSAWGHDGYALVSRRYIDYYGLWAHALGSER